MNAAFTKPTPVPKMPSGLVELMEGLTKDILKHNPTDVYEFCALHMEKLLEIRDGPSPVISLEKKIVKAQEKVRLRNKQHWKQYLKSLGTVSDSHEKASKEVVGTDSSAITKSVVNKVPDPVHHENDLSNASEMEISLKEPCNNRGDEIESHIEPIASVSINTKSENENEKIQSNNFETDLHKNHPENSLDESNCIDINSTKEPQPKPEHLIIQGLDNLSTIPVVTVSDSEEIDKFEDVNGQDQTELQHITDFDANKETLMIISNTEMLNENKAIFANEHNDYEESENITIEIKDPMNNVEDMKLQSGDDTSIVLVDNKNTSIENDVKETDTKLIEDVLENQYVKNNVEITNDKSKTDLIAPNEELNLKSAKVEQSSYDEEEINTNKENDTDKSEATTLEVKLMDTDGIQLEEKGISFYIGGGDSTASGENDIVKDAIKLEMDPMDKNKQTHDEKNFEDNVCKSEEHHNEKSENHESSGIIKPFSIETDNEKSEIAYQENVHKNQKVSEKDKIDNTSTSKELHDKVMISNEEQKAGNAIINKNNLLELDPKINGNVKESIVNSAHETSHNNTAKTETVDNIEKSPKISNLNATEEDGNIMQDGEVDDNALKSTDFGKSETSGLDGNMKDITKEPNLNGNALRSFDDNSISTLLSENNTNEEKSALNKDGLNENENILSTPDFEKTNHKDDTKNTTDETNYGLEKNVHSTLEMVKNPVDINSSADSTTTEESNSVLEGANTEHTDETVQNNTANPMDLETAAVTIQKVFRTFLFKSRNSTFDESTNEDNNLSDDDTDEVKDNNDSRSFLPPNLNKDRRTLGISRMDTVLQTVNEEKSLSLSTDDSSLSSAATIIQAHVRGFLVRNKLNSTKTASSNKSLITSDGPSSMSQDGDVEQNKNKTVLNIHIVSNGNHFMSRDESTITSMDLSLDGSPPSSINLHPLGYDKSERRKRLKREDAVQSVSPPSNNSGKLSEESNKELPINNHIETLSTEQVALTKDDLKQDSTELGSFETIPSNSDTINTVVDDHMSVKELSSPEHNIESLNNNKNKLIKQNSDEMDVVTPYKDTSYDTDISQKLLHSGECHDAVIPTKVSRSNTPMASEFKNVLVYFLLWQKV